MYAVKPAREGGLQSRLSSPKLASCANCSAISACRGRTLEAPQDVKHDMAVVLGLEKLGHAATCRFP